jgi:hypothetical protein
MTVLTGVTGVEQTVLPGPTFITSNAPNPFGDRTTIHFRMGTSGQVDMQVMDVRGRLVKHLTGDSFEEGHHSMGWDGRNSQGRKAPAGVYFVKMQVGSSVSTHRMVLAR